MKEKAGKDNEDKIVLHKERDALIVQFYNAKILLLTACCVISLMVTSQISHGNHETFKVTRDLRPQISLGILVPQILMCYQQTLRPSNLREITQQIVSNKILALCTTCDVSNSTNNASSSLCTTILPPLSLPAFSFICTPVSLQCILSCPCACTNACTFGDNAWEYHANEKNSNGGTVIVQFLF